MAIDVQYFQKDVIETSRQVPVVVDFWAEWCGPCRVLGPVLDRLEEKAAGEWRLAKVDVDQNQDVAQTYRIQGIPAVKLFHQGEEIAEFVGALPEDAVAKWLGENLPNESKVALQSGLDAIEAGDTEKGRVILEAVLGEDPENLAAKVALAGLMFEDCPGEAVEMVREVEPNHERYDWVQAMRTLYQMMDRRDPGGESKAWSCYIVGLEALRNHDYDTALASFIEVLEMGGRDVDNDGARRGCIAVFHWLGEEDDVTQKYRRQFSSALF
jgi:putative thioredoxin